MTETKALPSELSLGDMLIKASSLKHYEDPAGAVKLCNSLAGECMTRHGAACREGNLLRAQEIASMRLQIAAQCRYWLGYGHGLKEGVTRGLKGNVVKIPRGVMQGRVKATFSDQEEGGTK